MPHALYIVFLFMLGACVGSFLNVVVWRLPRLQLADDTPWWKTPWFVLKHLSHPPSRCPKCEKSLKPYDNIPILGWIKLGGKCRFCKLPISSRYPIVEAVTALLFVGLYVSYYILQVGPCAPIPLLTWSDAPGLMQFQAPGAGLFFLHVLMLAALLAASLIDGDEMIIPQSIPLTLLALGLAMHTVFDDPHQAGSLNLVRVDDIGQRVVLPWAAVAAGGSIGLIISLLLSGMGWLKKSFAKGEPLFPGEQEVIEAANKERAKAGEPLEDIPPEYTRGRLSLEILREFLFMLPPIVLGVLWWQLTAHVPAIRSFWLSLTNSDAVTGFLGAALGALVGGATVWIVRILGTLGFGKLAMGLGDVDLMFGVGAVIGAGPSVIAFFIAPFFGLLTALYLLMTGKQKHLPYGPYLSMASAAVLLCYCPIEGWLKPGLDGLGLAFSEIFGR